MDICLFWHGRNLRYVDRVCVASMVAAGHKVRLFTYGEIGNAPGNIELRDASEIIDEALFRRLVFFGPRPDRPLNLVQFSDIFRIALMKHGMGAWLDTDVYLVNPFSPAPDKPYLAWENRRRVGVSALYFPAGNPVIAEFDAYLRDFLDGRIVLPNWLGFRRRVVRPWGYRLLGREVAPATCGLTIFGNDGISRLARRHGFINQSAPKESFYYWNGDEALRIYEPAYGLEPLNHPEFIGFHIHRKSRSDEPPAEGSFYHWAVERVRDYL